MGDQHTCSEIGPCRCYLLALEPSEKCPLHGIGEWPPRCATCGRFMKRKEITDEREDYYIILKALDNDGV